MLPTEAANGNLDKTSAGGNAGGAAERVVGDIVRCVEEAVTGDVSAALQILSFTVLFCSQLEL